ncbi:MAG: hypothetical protein AAF629_29770 [Chloroflexota bacterium]
MSDSSIPNPVTAIAEADATGETAKIFADIRQTMEIPLITSVWRILVDVDEGLRPAWEVTKPLYQSGQPQAALLKLRRQATFPKPEPLTPSQLACVGVSQTDLPTIRAIVDAYNRSNGLNLIALTALTVDPSGTSANALVPPSPPPWPTLPSLLAQDEITPDTWTVLRDIYHLGLLEKKPGVATIWRHLAHWPGLMALAQASLSPLAQNGSLQRTMVTVRKFAQSEAGRIAHLRPDTDQIPLPAYNYVAQYAVGVHRIVAIGHIFAEWLRTLDD